MEHRFAAPTGMPLPPGRASTRLVTGLLPDAAQRPRAAAAASDAPLWSALFGDAVLSEAELAALAAIAQRHPVVPGQAVLSRSAAAHALVALQQGEVALGLRTADGTFRTERIVRGPAWLDQGSAWLDEPHAMDAQALGAATVLELPRQALETCLTDHPGLARRLIRGLAREVQALAANTHELMHKDAPARLAQWLHQRQTPVAGAAPGQAVVTLHERKRDVASQLAITPETLSRLMRSFIRQGVIEVAGYSVRILDTAALARLAAG